MYYVFKLKLHNKSSLGFTNDLVQVGTDEEFNWASKMDARWTTWINIYQSSTYFFLNPKSKYLVRLWFIVLQVYKGG
jgi:hypothetical protein